MKKKFSLAVDFSWSGSTGIGKIVDEITNRCPSNWEIIPIRQGASNAHFLTPIHLFNELRNMNADVFWSPGFMPPFARINLPVVITIHDLIHRKYHSIIHRLYYDCLIKRFINNVDMVITVSDYSKKELLEWSNIPDAKIRRIYSGAGSEFSKFGKKYSIGRPYILYSGNRRKHKNLERLIRSFKLSGLCEQGFVLGFTGEQDDTCRELNNIIESEFIHYFGYVDKSDMPALIRGAHALVLVSLDEGFGLPILEGMASGVPVLTSNVAAMPEVAGNSALLVNPLDQDQIQQGLVDICLNEHLRADLIDSGTNRARLFLWEETAAHYFATFTAVRQSSNDI